MHYGSESVARCHVNIGPGAHILNNIAEVDQVRRIQDVGRCGRATGQRNPGIVVRITTVEY